MGISCMCVTAMSGKSDQALRRPRRLKLVRRKKIDDRVWKDAYIKW